MSGVGDHDSEMSRRQATEDAVIEAFFTGHGTQAVDLGPLVVFAEELRTMAAGPVPPVRSAELAALLAEGFSTDTGELPAAAGSSASGPAANAAGLTKWRKRKMIVETLAGLSLAAKATLGVSVAAASVTAAGAAGALPGPAQHAVSSAVEAVTPFSFPDEAHDRAEFGERVSAEARDGGVDGTAVSEAARQQGAARRAEAPAAAAKVPQVEVEVDVDVDEDDGRGRPAQPGQTGLDRAAQTPAADHVPTSVPAATPHQGGPPAIEGHPSSAGLATANATPAAGRVPTELPGHGPGGTSRRT